MEQNNKPLVFLVDDDPVCQEMIRSAVLAMNFDFGVSHDGKDLQNGLKASKPSLVLLDVHLPTTDGFSLCEAMKSDPLTRDIPVLFLTVADDTGSIDRGFKVGGVDYVTKPFRVSELVARIAVHVNYHVALSRISLEAAMKQKLFTLISHDLRSPFSSMIGVLQLLLQEYETMNEKDRKEFLRALLDNCSQQLQLLDNLSYWSRGESKRIVVNPRNVPLVALIAGVGEQLSEMATAKKITMDIDVGTSLSVYVDTDLSRSILRNIVHNAIKYSPIGGRVSVRARPTSEKDGPESEFCEVLIIDSGSGVRQTSGLFDIHSTSTPFPGTGGEKGSGLGLAISRTLALAQGGDVRLVSSGAEGSTFCIVFRASSKLT